MPVNIKHYNPSATDATAGWLLVDAKNEVLGRMASKIAQVLMGKDRPRYVRHLISGDFVVVVNAELVRVTGKKYDEKIYRRHSGRPGGLVEIPFKVMISKHPERVIKHAVKGMLPKSKLGARMLRRLKVYAGSEHPHDAQIKGYTRMLERIEQEKREKDTQRSTAEATDQTQISQEEEIGTLIAATASPEEQTSGKSDSLEDVQKTSESDEECVASPITDLKDDEVKVGKDTLKREE